MVGFISYCLWGSLLEKPPSLKSVAERAGVATTTVARVLHNNGYVAEATREKVMKAVDEADYRINHIARSLKRNRSNVIGHLLQSTLPNPFFVKVARGVESYCRENGYTVLTYNVQGDAAAERRGVETFLDWRVDAIIFSTPMATENVDYALSASIPVVQVERPRSKKGMHILADNTIGATQAMQHLLALGHREIFFIGQQPGTEKMAIWDYVEAERFGAYRDAMSEIGGFDQEKVAFGSVYSLDQDAGSVSKNHGYQAMKKWLDVGTVPTAVFSGSDMLAVGILQAIYEHGLNVPNDISVVGFDDTMAPFMAPPLTTVRLPTHDLGVAAARIAIAQLENREEMAPQAYKYETMLVERGSTGPAKQG